MLSNSHRSRPTDVTPVTEVGLQRDTKYSNYILYGRGRVEKYVAEYSVNQMKIFLC